MAPGRLGDRGLAGGRDLLRGEGAVGRTQAQGEGEGPMTLGHLRSDIDIEEPNVFAQLPRSRAQGLLDIGGGHRLGHDESDVLLGDRLDSHIRGRRDIDRACDERVEIDLHRTGTGRKVESGHDSRMEFARVANDEVVDDQTCRAAGMEGRVGCLSNCEHDAERVADRHGRIDGITPGGLTTWSPPAFGLTQAR